jgi:hypothetical protein
MSFTPVEALAGQLQREQINRALGEANSTITATFGPFFIADLPGTATTQAQSVFYNTSSASNIGNRDIRMPRAGRIVGLVVTSDDDRTAGTATVRARVDGVGAAFDGGSVVLNATDVARSSGLVAYASGVAFTAGQLIGCEVVTSGWTPTTANLSLFVIVQFEAF